MSCSGIHCAGCAGGAAVPVVPLAATLGLAWVAEHIIEVAVTAAVCGALAVAAVVWLMRRQERREAVHAARRPLLTMRDVPAAVAPARRRAVTASVINLNFYSQGGEDTAARVIRTAIERNGS